MRRILFILLIGVFCLSCTLSSLDGQNVDFVPQQASASSDFHAPVASSTPAPTENALVTVTAVEALNLRASAGIHAHILEVLPTGTELYVLGNCTYDNGYWVNVVTEDREAGWVNQTYLSERICE